MLALVRGGSVAELGAVLMQRMEFGTAGLRARMGPGFARMNDLTIVQTSQGLCAYVLDSVPDARERGIVVGYDARHNSARFARLAAAVFVAAGVRTRLFSAITPTPYVPYAVRKYAAAAGVMVTASHNPKEDNGYKVYWSNGAQITSPHDKRIAAAIEQHLQPLPSSWNWSACERHELCVDPYADVHAAYVADLSRRLCRRRNANRTASLRITYTPMHGVGLKFAAALFDAFALPPFIAVEQQSEPDPDFPTVAFPNPEEGRSALVRAAPSDAAPRPARALPPARASPGKSGLRWSARTLPARGSLSRTTRMPIAWRWRKGTPRTAPGASSPATKSARCSRTGYGAASRRSPAMMHVRGSWRDERRGAWPFAAAARLMGRHCCSPIAAVAVMLSSAVSSKILEAMAAKEGFVFEVRQRAARSVGFDRRTDRRLPRRCVPGDSDRLQVDGQPSVPTAAARPSRAVRLRGGHRYARVPRHCPRRSA